MKKNIFNVFIVFFGMATFMAIANENSLKEPFDNLFKDKVQKVLKSQSFDPSLNVFSRNHISITKNYYKNSNTRKETSKRLFGKDYEKLRNTCISQIEKVDQFNYIEVAHSILFLTDILVDDRCKPQLKRMYFDPKYEKVKDEILVGLARLGDRSVEKDLLIRLLHNNEINTSLNYYPKPTDKVKNLIIWDQKRSYFIDGLSYIDSEKLKPYVERFQYDGGNDTAISIISYLLRNNIVTANINKLIIPALKSTEGMNYFKLLSLMHSHKAYFKENKAVKDQLYSNLNSERVDLLMPTYQMLKVILTKGEFGKKVIPLIDVKIRGQVVQQLEHLIDWLDS